MARAGRTSAAGRLKHDAQLQLLTGALDSDHHRIAWLVLSQHAPPGPDVADFLAVPGDEAVPFMDTGGSSRATGCDPADRHSSRLVAVVAE